uniref:F-box only protein 31-like n=1 Tax=Saccoglossus kowalevskii TaxID=10224 RepID=A0ABM0M427_SACKO|nr:PREDICTED: F-box only protein 31-like [Saccoglossus kowalevskii]
MATILSLPPELLTYLLSFLPGVDLPRAASVCKQFNESVAVDLVWQKRCNVEYGVDKLEGWRKPTFRDMYAKILHPYGYLLGLWQPEIGPYGGLVYIEVVYGSILATLYQPPCDPNVTAPLRKKACFSITLTEDGRTELRCLKGPKGPHKCVITSVSITALHFHSYELQAWLEEELGNSEEFLHDHIQELLLMKFMIKSQYETVCLYKRIHLPEPMHNVPIQPGLFKGTYGSHGVEVVNLTYQDMQILGTKVTGDPNVPACQLSIEADLSEPLRLSLEQQQTLAILELVDKEDVIVRDQGLGEEQPFKLPHGVSDRGMNHIQDRIHKTITTCRARYFGTGLIASHGFMNSSRTPGHLIVFSEDVFGFLWLELRSLSIYSRVHEKFV